MKLLVTGGCGFLGSNLASHAITQGFDVVVFDNLSRKGATSNLEWLTSIGKFTFVHGDIRNKNDVVRLIAKYKPDCCFHLAGQVAMTTSIDNPFLDFEINAGGTFNLLESIRQYKPECKVIYSSTNKVYGDLEQFNYIENDTRYTCEEKPNGFDETTQLNFHSPYGCSKGAADQYMLDYSRIFGLNTVVFRHSSMYGGRQFSTYDQGWVGWFCQKAHDVKKGIRTPFTISGNGKQVRDVLHADDMISLYFSTLSAFDNARGQVFNVGGTIDNSLSLLELFAVLEEYVGIDMVYDQLPVRESDQKVFVADTAKINQTTGWRPKVSAEIGVQKMYDWVSTL
ncbi:NAD-dependent epimerase/dehydratase family protein [Kosakonia sacchari]|uniref:NAD-dependent epimerase/dehydratase family protein n=1 Tax=Kosakonia sacchari TaxID=1158459 RepID=UPI002ACDA60B|nr:NAD-dependent epimerase/dehydratase family protein [Kosakonia sacchari]MDZ7324867.1 NAD-dependent epimerase/dehydratase family protein [Kosakonia sacchari]